MQAKLNYYSRYNRIKDQGKKSIPSLYSLLSTQTLNKLAHDASVSLQMISFYNRQNHFMMAQEQANESEYLQASKNKFNHSLYHSLDEKAHSVSPSAKNSRDHKMTSSLVKRQRISKRKYLENLVKEVRQKSLQRLKETQNSQQQQIKKKGQKSRKSKAIMKEIMAQEVKQSYDVDKLQESKNPDPKLKIQNKYIKSLLTEGDNKVQLSKQSMSCQKKQMMDKQNFQKQYVQSVEDQNQQHSKHSIVIERVNLMKKNVIEESKNKEEKQISKEDSPSEKESEIKSFSRESIQKHKPTKNLISVELTHSQSQIWKPQQRSLDVPKQQHQQKECLPEQSQNIKLHQLDKNEQTPSPRDSLADRPNIQKTLSIFSKEQQLQQQMNDLICEPLKQLHQSYPMSKSYKIINSQSPIQFLSQLNHHKQVEEAPFQHPLQTYTLPKKFSSQQENNTPRDEPKTDGPKKTSFKKFIMNKELNPRLVTSTILNQKNTLAHHPFPKDFIKDSSLQKEKEKEKLKQNEQPTKINEEISVKKNFKKMLMTKKAPTKDPIFVEKEQKVIPLRRLQNKKLLHGFFNDNE